MLQDLNFKKLVFNSRKEILTGTDETGQYFIKIEVVKNKNKLNDIKKEYEIIKHLNDNDCKTCPEAYEFGTIQKKDFYSKVENRETLDSIKKEKFKYIIQDFIPDNGYENLADIMLGVIEQKELDNSSFLDFCSEHDKERHGIGNWLRHFPQFTDEDVENLFKGEAFNLGKTTIFKTQNTTNTVTGIYHTINEKDIFIDGSRTLGVRGRLLDSLEFAPDEKVLDVGCNSGLLSIYAHDRGCKATGVDNDPHIVIASKIVSNILNKDIDYYHLDLDEVDSLDNFDTIMLFSVFHHTKNPIKNAKKIVESCSRIILETRLIEKGKQPSEEGWVDTTNWSFDSIADLTSFCEDTFSGFKLKNNLGRADKNRFILEFVK